MPWGHKWLNREMKEVEERRGKGERDQKGDILNRLYWSENRNVEMKEREREKFDMFTTFHESVFEPSNWIRNKKLFRYRKINK